jgi:hypothetical protein
VHWRGWGSGLPGHELNVVDDLGEESRHLPTNMRREGERGSPPARKQVLLAHLLQISSPLPARPEKVSAGPEGRQDDVGREISSRHLVKFTWGTHLPPLNLPACVALACSCSSPRQHCHSLHSHQSPCRRGHDLRLQGSSPCMGRSSSPPLSRSVRVFATTIPSGRKTPAQRGFHAFLR